MGDLLSLWKLIVQWGGGKGYWWSFCTSSTSQRQNILWKPRTTSPSAFHWCFKGNHWKHMNFFLLCIACSIFCHYPLQISCSSVTKGENVCLVCTLKYLFSSIEILGFYLGLIEALDEFTKLYIPRILTRMTHS